MHQMVEPNGHIFKLRLACKVFKDKIAELKSEHTKLKSRMDRLADLFLDGVFDEKSYKEKRESLEQNRKTVVAEILFFLGKTRLTG